MEGPVNVTMNATYMTINVQLRNQLFLYPYHRGSSFVFVGTDETFAAFVYDVDGYMPPPPIDVQCSNADAANYVFKGFPYTLVYNLALLHSYRNYQMIVKQQ